jgi:hypothetical protein
VVDEVYDGLGEPTDRAFFTAPTMPHKALLSMRLAPERGDVYVRVENPLR